MNPNLQQLQAYPIEKLHSLFHGIASKHKLKKIDLSIGEPKHPTPQFIRDALSSNLDKLAHYTTTIGSVSLRNTIAHWLQSRYSVSVNPSNQIIVTLGSREAIFSLAQAVLDNNKTDGLVLCPNPFYQIYEGATFLAGLKPYFINAVTEEHYSVNWSKISDNIWRKIQLVFICSPNNPNGSVMTLEEWRQIFSLSDKYGFVIAADECYTDIYIDENKPPLGALEAAVKLGRDTYHRLVVLGSLSKRSNAPGMRSGFVAGDSAIIKEFARYRTYHGSAMGGAIQAASEQAWKDESHVRENRRLYAEKFKLFHQILHPVLPLLKPSAAFYYWIKTPIDDKTFTVALRKKFNVIVLPGSFLSHTAHGMNPGKNYIRIALVAPIKEIIESAKRIRSFVEQL